MDAGLPSESDIEDTLEEEAANEAAETYAGACKPPRLSWSQQASVEPLAKDVRTCGSAVEEEDFPAEVGSSLARDVAAAIELSVCALCSWHSANADALDDGRAHHHHLWDGVRARQGGGVGDHVQQ